MEESRNGLVPVNPASLGSPRGYSNGMLAPSVGALLFIAGQIGWDQDQKLTSDDLVDQFDRALANVIAVVEEAGGSAERIARLTIYVTNKEEYRNCSRAIGEKYRARMGRRFPAMALVEVKSLLEDRAKIEIEGIAVLPAAAT